MGKDTKNDKSNEQVLDPEEQKRAEAMAE